VHFDSCCFLFFFFFHSNFFLPFQDVKQSNLCCCFLMCVDVWFKLAYLWHQHFSTPPFCKCCGC
jgi:hypothetical protein